MYHKKPETLCLKLLLKQQADEVKQRDDPVEARGQFGTRLSKACSARH